jgi:hypothetical protein
MGLGYSYRSMKNTHEFVGTKYSLAQWAQLDCSNRNLPRAIVLDARASKGSCNYLMTKTDP